MNSRVAFAVYLTQCINPESAIAVFEFPDHAVKWAKDNYQGRGWEIVPVYSPAFVRVTLLKESDQ